jgi:hypothetical protein
MINRDIALKRGPIGASREAAFNQEVDVAMTTGETYRCTNPNCGCEMKVTQGAKAGGGGEAPPRCCCGTEMKKAS